ncbi:MAG TPA: DUF4254 domain-containing protein [Candidatus Binatia bacterium]|nr:DUF4254 domain-containing protein [Candidatus Binatia bacterium]
MSLADLDVRALHDHALAQWNERHGAALPPPPPAANPDEAEVDLESLVLRQHFANFAIWRLEDEARRRDVGDEVIASVKRAIDPWNQHRNDLMERIDAVVLSELGARSEGELHSETAAMMVDRLSILALKIRNMERLSGDAQSDAELREECAGRASILREQRDDLAGCLKRLLEDFAAGRRHFKMYRQLKSYNDPRLNPRLRSLSLRGQSL